MSNPKPYSEQFRECKAAGLTNETENVKLADHPKYLPAFPYRTMRDAIRSGKFSEVTLIVCGRFGGRCSSRNPECLKLRGAIS